MRAITERKIIVQPTQRNGIAEPNTQITLHAL